MNDLGWFCAIEGILIEPGGIRCDGLISRRISSRRFRQIELSKQRLFNLWRGGRGFQRREFDTLSLVRLRRFHEYELGSRRLAGVNPVVSIARRDDGEKDARVQRSRHKARQRTLHISRFKKARTRHQGSHFPSPASYKSPVSSSLQEISLFS